MVVKLLSKFCKETVKYKRNLPVKVYDGETLVSGYLYTPEGKLKAQITYAKEDENNYIRIYTYKDSQIAEVKQYMARGRLSSNPSEIDLAGLEGQAGEEVLVQKYDYKSKGNNRKVLTVTDGLGISNILEYDSFGNVVSMTDGNGEVKKTTYTAQGRVTGEESSHGGWYKYVYDNKGQIIKAGEEGKSYVTVGYNQDGSIAYKTDRYGKSIIYSYDKAGRIKSISSENTTVWYTYDTEGNVISEVTGSSPYKETAVYYKTYKYTEDGRSVTVTEGDKYSVTVELDAFGNIVKTTDGNGNTTEYEYDSLGNITASLDGYHNKTSYTYNALGKVSTITAPDGNRTRYEYNYLGEVSRITDGEGVVYTATYDKAGRVIKERQRSDVERTYEYDNAGRVVKVKSGGKVAENYTYSKNGRTVTVTDGKGKDFVYSYDEFGRLKEETNKSGNKGLYYYDEEGSLNKKVSFDGSTTTVEYSGDRLTKKVIFSDGTSNVFVYDALGNITEAENEYGKTLYEYDKAELLIRQTDCNTGETVAFAYDNAKNRIKLSSSNRSTVYTYGSNNEVKEVIDYKEGIDIRLKYNVNGQETERLYSSGVAQNTYYDKAGRIILITQKDGNGNVTWGEGYIYGADGKRKATVDNTGAITLYSYNAQGQIETVSYPYTKEMEQKLKEEAELHNMTSMNYVAVNEYLDSEVMSEAAVLLNRMTIGWSNRVTSLQLFIKESYKYDENGNRSAKITPYGTIEYVYDEDNCLKYTCCRGVKGIEYTYDNNGNLLIEKSVFRTVKYAYNAQNRLIYSEVTDSKEHTQTVSCYGYDAFGRRIIVQDRDEAALRSIYDGFTFDVIKESQTFANGMFTDTYETGIRKNRTGKITGERYRYLEDEKNNDTRYRYLDDGSYKNVSTRYRGSRTSISVNGKIASQNADGNVTYYITDVLGTVRTVTGARGEGEDSYSYDVFGSLISGNLNDSRDYGYLGKQFDKQTGVYNYGYRDYAPHSARFTTVDPIRDGSNWFAYVNNDAVNFVDLWGLCSDKASIGNKIEDFLEATVAECGHAFGNLSNLDFGVAYVGAAAVEIVNNEVTKIHQVGKVNKNRTPIIRESEAIEDIINSPDYNSTVYAAQKELHVLRQWRRCQKQLLDSYHD